MENTVFQCPAAGNVLQDGGLVIDFTTWKITKVAKTIARRFMVGCREIPICTVISNGASAARVTAVRIPTFTRTTRGLQDRIASSDAVVRVQGIFNKVRSSYENNKSLNNNVICNYFMTFKRNFLIYFAIVS